MQQTSMIDNHDDDDDDGGNVDYDSIFAYRYINGIGFHLCIEHVC